MGDRKGTSRGWHITRAEGTLTLSRRLPARFDLGVGTVLPQVARPERLAHQVRQDLWRALRDLRGFAPCVRITPQDGQPAPPPTTPTARHPRKGAGPSAVRN